MGTVVVVVVILYFVMAYIFNKETLADGSIEVYKGLNQVQ